MFALQREFIEIYFRGVDHPPLDLKTEFTRYIAVWHQSKALKEIASARRVQFFNATRGGLIDVIPPVEFESIPLGSYNAHTQIFR
jgi:hypothetical protein